MSDEIVEKVAALFNEALTEKELRDALAHVGADYINLSDKVIEGTEESRAAASAAIDAINKRSYAVRNNLNPMVNCPVCDLRHRGPQCKQKFTLDKEGLERMCELNTRNGVNGAPQRRNWSMPRFNPHPNKRKLAVIRIVHGLLKQEYTKEELDKARVVALKAVYGDKPRSLPATTPKKVKKDVTSTATSK